MKFLNGAEHIEYAETPLHILVLWVSLIVGCTFYYFYLRIFYPQEKPWTKIEEINIRRIPKDD